MPTLESNQQAVRDISPFEGLNERFQKQSAEVSEYISRLTSSLHKVNNTNVTTESSNKCIADPDPFSEGHLLSYYRELRDMDIRIGLLAEQVAKLESLT